MSTSVNAASDLAFLMGSVARHLLGEPNKALSSTHELRYGAKGSLSIDLNKGTYFDHENNEGGGVLDLILREINNIEPMDWLVSNGFIEPRRANGQHGGPYYYEDAQGRKCRKVRTGNPTIPFYWQHLENGQWELRRGDAEPLLYHLQEIQREVRDDRTVFIFEGEKDVDNARALGVAATCNADGASKNHQKPKWTPEHSAPLRGTDVVVGCDNDETGRAHAKAALLCTLGVARRVRFLDIKLLYPACPEKGDVSDWIDHGGTLEQLLEFVEKLPDWRPDNANDNAQQAEAKPADALPVSEWLGAKPETPPPTLIKNVLPQTGVASIAGQSGAGKTFFAIQIGLCLMPDTKQNFFIDQYRINRKGGVLYFALEGKAVFRTRVNAALERMLGVQMELGERGRLPFAWNSYSPNLFTKKPDELIRLIERDAAEMRSVFGVDLVAIFFDTVSKAALYENEDRSAQIHVVHDKFSKVSDATGALIIPIDHMGKDQEKGPRGSSGKRDVVETQLACLVDTDENGTHSNRRLVLQKVRDGEEGRVIPYQLDVVPRGLDEHGDPITTCVVTWEPNRPPPPRPLQSHIRRPSTNDRLLNEAIDALGGLPTDAIALRDKFYDLHGGTNHAANKAWNDAKSRAGLEIRDGKICSVL